jgi:choline dehydrogenase-like flavoprotein
VKKIAEQNLPATTEYTVKYCVIGSGPAGTTIAEELSEKGHSVSIIESGVDEPDDSIQKLNKLNSSGYPLRPDFVNRLRMLGGTSNLWPGRCMPFEPIDFQERPWIAHSGWPISFSEYKQYLPAAAKKLGVLSKKVTELTSNPEAYSEYIDTQKLSIKYALWGKGAKRFRENYQDKKNDNLTLISGFTVTNFVFDETGVQLRQIKAQNLAGKVITINADKFVLTCGGIENARMLLLAKQQNTQAKFSNENIGRFYMDHPRAVKGHIVLNDKVDWSHFLGHPIHQGIQQLGIGLSDKMQADKKLLNSYIYFEPFANELLAKGYDSSVQVLKRVLRKGHTGKRLDFSNMTKISDLVYQLTPKEVLPNWLYRIYFNLRKLVKTHKRDLMIINHCEQFPDPNSRITLTDELDAFGNPYANLHWVINDLDVVSLQVTQQILAQWIKEQDFGELVSEPMDLTKNDFQDASHHIGTTRMSKCNEDGVVDTNLKVHDIDNLYVCGSSIFPTSGSCNPTWSIVAFSIRLAKHLNLLTKQEA